MNTEKIKPLGDRALVKRLAREEKTAGGLFIPETAAQEKGQVGKVIAIGAGRVLTDGSVVAMQVKPGDLVFVGKYSGTDAGKDEQGDEYVIVKEDEILGLFLP